MKKTALPVERLHDLLSYDRESGLFRWRVRRGGRSNGIAGSLQRSYLAIRVDGLAYPAHRLAWLYVHGVFPLEDLDHINGDRLDNRLSNLREASRSENNQNIRAPRKHSSSQLLGAFKHQSGFISKITVNKSQRYLGAFSTAELAHEAYLKAKKAFHPFSTL